ncbi:transglycosylase SLT domain-containing protein [Pantoea sp. Aalb]|uniref:transglycosylase SLT domain-containing protein n=1 Tax=Pantoea sp. Aalb TaxID=2576762 RepID=UPI001324CDCE|nr:transglycosylase SLT domain-containing protein [Pantoea sp. Aalb]MXP67443.1 lytic transglycosylase [Pantoea sp. Aalb]
MINNNYYYKNKNLIVKIFIFITLLLTGCAKGIRKEFSFKNIFFTQYPSLKIHKLNKNNNWERLTENAANHYGVDKKLINAIINVESGGNPNAVSSSHAVGLMQIKASTAGREVYYSQGRKGQPSFLELRDPVNNINIGVAYIKILQSSMLAGIRNPLTLRYATIVSYANGASALLRTFDNNRNRAIAMINIMTPDQFYQHVENKHPASQAQLYLWKVTRAYRIMN